MKIDWRSPQPRKGFIGYWDKFVGPGATTAELTISLIPSLAAGVAVILYAAIMSIGWTFIQYLLAFVLAVDIVGGVITNATSSAKRWYHRPGQGLKEHLGFLLLHILHLFLFAWFFRGQDWTFFTFFSVLLAGSAIIILTVPLYLERPIALLAYLIALTASFYFFTPTPGMEWFLPFFFLKLLVSHALKEAPFSPDDSSKSAS